MGRTKRYFITGLVVVIPVFLTFYVLLAIFNFLDNILGRFLEGYFKRTFGFDIPGMGFLIFLLVIFFTGFFASRFIRYKIFIRFEKWFSGLPLISNIYPAVKQIILFVSAQKEFGFKKVVLVEYPGKGIWSIGFLTNEGFDNVNRSLGKEMFTVYMPTCPNPLTGSVVFIAKEEVKFPDISINAALNIIISGGVFKSED
jgi:uncharacterized membrane protein